NAISARSHLAIVHMARGDRQRAREEIERILEIDPGNAAARIDSGIHAIAEGQIVRALEAFDRALESDASSARARFYRAVVLDLMGRAAEAEEALLDVAGGADDKYADRARRHLTERLARRERGVA